MELKRGDVVVVASPGDYSSKPRPAVVVQSDLFNASSLSITVCPLTSLDEAAETLAVRPTIVPTDGNGLRKLSAAMVDKLITVRRQRVAKCVGSLNAGDMLQVDQGMANWLGLRLVAGF